MIRCIVAMDQQRGIATEHGIPWDLPIDQRYFRDKTIGSTVVMGYNTYLEFAAPLPDRKNIVATTNSESLRPGFIPVSDALAYLIEAKEDIWVIGGASLFQTTIGLAEELYVTELAGDFNCTKFFPDFSSEFELLQRDEPITENGITFCFAVYRRRSL